MQPNFENVSDKELANDSSQPGSQADKWTNLEFKRRELEIHRSVADAQKAAANAQISAATWTKRSAIAVMVSVIVAAIGIWVNYLTN